MTPGTVEEPGPSARFKEKGLKYGFAFLSGMDSHWIAIILFRNADSNIMVRVAVMNQSKLPPRPVTCL